MISALQDGHLSPQQRDRDEDDGDGGDAQPQEDVLRDVVVRVVVLFTVVHHRAESRVAHAARVCCLGVQFVSFRLLTCGALEVVDVQHLKGLRAVSTARLLFCRLGAVQYDLVDVFLVERRASASARDVFKPAADTPRAVCGVELARVFEVGVCHTTKGGRREQETPKEE